MTRLPLMALASFLALVSCGSPSTVADKSEYTLADYNEALSCYFAGMVLDAAGGKSAQDAADNILLQEVMNRGGFLGKTRRQVRADLLALQEQLSEVEPSNYLAEVKKISGDSAQCLKDLGPTLLN